MSRAPVVFFVDVDNTLLDNDAVIADLKAHLMSVFGDESQRRYWQIFEELRTQLGYADYLGTLQRLREESVCDQKFLEVALFLTNYPFANRLFSRSLDALARFRTWGPTVILTDGDVVFQPRKIWRSGLYERVEGRVLIYIHKEIELADVEARYPADHYVVVDDKLKILTAIKAVWRERVTTVFVRQGHYASDVETLRGLPPADVTIETIGDAVGLTRETLRLPR